MNNFEKRLPIQEKAELVHQMNPGEDSQARGAISPSTGTENPGEPLNLNVPYRIMQIYANLKMAHYGSLKKYNHSCLLGVKCEHVLSSPDLHSLQLWNMTLITQCVWSNEGDVNLLSVN